MSNSFADLLGDFPTLEDALQETAETPDGTARSLTDVTETSDPAWEAVVSAMLDVSDLPATEYKQDLQLQADFDLHPIALFAVVSKLEEDLKVKLADAEVQQCVTLADLVKLAQAALGK